MGGIVGIPIQGYACGSESDVSGWCRGQVFLHGGGQPKWACLRSGQFGRVFGTKYEGNDQI